MEQQTVEPLEFTAEASPEEASCQTVSSVTNLQAVPGVELYLFGRQPHGISWRLGEREHPNEEAIKRIGEFASRRGVQDIFAPTLDFSARVCRRDGFSTELVYRPTSAPPIHFHRGPRGDVLEIKRGEAALLCSADCPTLIVKDITNNRVLCAHAGRDALFDRNHLLNNAPARPYASVVDAIVNELGAHMTTIDFNTYIACGIGGTWFTHPFHHPQYGPVHRTIVEHLTSSVPWYAQKIRDRKLNADNGHLFLHSIIQHQIFTVPRVFSYREVKIDTIDTYGDLGKDGAPLWWSYRRGDGDKRNGVLVIFRE